MDSGAAGAPSSTVHYEAHASARRRLLRDDHMANAPPTPGSGSMSVDGEDNDSEEVVETRNQVCISLNVYNKPAPVDEVDVFAPVEIVLKSEGVIYSCVKLVYLVILF